MPLFVAFILLVPLAMLLFAIISGLISIFGPPYVPAPHSIVDRILKEMALQPDQLFVDLGSGDGWVVRRAISRYQVSGWGVEINPFLYLYSCLSSVVFGIQNCRFTLGSYLSVDLSKASTIYVYPIPSAIPAWRDKISRECKKGTIVASFRFSVPGWEKLLIKQLDFDHHSAYLYRL